MSSASKAVKAVKEAIIKILITLPRIRVLTLTFKSIGM